MEIEDLLEQLKRDFDNSNTPHWYDPATINTMTLICLEIRRGNFSKPSFEDYVDDNFGAGDFAKGCKKYVESVNLFFDSANSYRCRGEFVQFIEGIKG